MCKLKKIRLKDEFYSPEFNRKFYDENAVFIFKEDKNRKGHYHICVNDISLVQWFRQKANEWRNGFGIVSIKKDKILKKYRYTQKFSPKANKNIRRQEIIAKISYFCKRIE